ncbi:MAG: hypothetical protein ACE5EF_14500, partial [Dehalococcoidia bacterium]
MSSKATTLWTTHDMPKASHASVEPIQSTRKPRLEKARNEARAQARITAPYYRHQPPPAAIGRRPSTPPAGARGH